LSTKSTAKTEMVVSSMAALALCCELQAERGRPSASASHAARPAGVRHGPARGSCTAGGRGGLPTQQAAHLIRQPGCTKANWKGNIHAAATAHNTVK
jgi:hypothetical protein